MEEKNPILLLIPMGVAHGNRVLGQKPAVIVYLQWILTDRKILTENEFHGMILKINFDWETRNR
jgi:dTDP-4-dehydrorhamnose 3,5-epimerase